MKSWTLVIVAVAIVAVAAGGYRYYASGAPVEAATVEIGEIQQFVEEQATTVLPSTTVVTMPLDGRIAAISMDVGDPVKQGEVVAQLVQEDIDIARRQALAKVEQLQAEIRQNNDDSIEQITLKQTLAMVTAVTDAVAAAAARVTSGRKKYETAIRHRKRIEPLVRVNSRTEEDLDEAELAEVTAGVDYDTDRLVLSSMQAIAVLVDLMPTLIRRQIERKQLAAAVIEQKLNAAEAELAEFDLEKGRTIMTSPIDGVVLMRAFHNERPVSAGTVLLELGRLDAMEVEAEVLSQDAVQIREGAVVEIIGPTIGLQPATGRVQRVEPTGFTKVSSLGVEQQRVRVKISLAEEELSRVLENRGLGVGYRVRVRIVTGSKSGALTIPRTAIFRSENGGWRVFAIRGRKAELQDVEVGLMNDDRVEIVKGLSADDRVVIAPESDLTDGARVKIQ
jgi:HlyD family secretion protein